jgi:hypothetical protein
MDNNLTVTRERLIAIGGEDEIIAFLLKQWAAISEAGEQQGGDVCKAEYAGHCILCSIIDARLAELGFDEFVYDAIFGSVFG